MRGLREHLYSVALPFFVSGITNKESPRVWELENRLKLLSIVNLVYTLLLYLLESLLESSPNQLRVSSVIEPESDAEKSRHRFTVYAG